MAGLDRLLLCGWLMSILALMEKKKLEGMFREIYSENSPLKAKSDEKKHIVSQMLVYTLLQISAYFFSELLFKFDLGPRKKARKKALRFRLGTL